MTAACNHHARRDKIDFAADKDYIMSAVDCYTPHLSSIGRQMEAIVIGRTHGQMLVTDRINVQIDAAIISVTTRRWRPR